MDKLFRKGHFHGLHAFIASWNIFCVYKLQISVNNDRWAIRNKVKY